MSEYTPEQIEQAKEWLESGDEYDKDHATCILASLKAAEQERDEWRESARTANTALLKVCKERDALVAYATKLEKAGDFMRGACPIIIARDNWGVARREKPGA